MPPSSDTPRVGWPTLVVGTAGLLVASVLGGFWALDRVAGIGYRDHACNDSDGNSHVEKAVVDLLPAATLRGYLNTGPDCDDRRSGSIAAGWQGDVRPADVVDVLVRDGWARTDPIGGPPRWYVDRELAGDPTIGCLSGGADPWQDPDRDEIPSRFCNQPVATQVALVAERDERIFVARLNANGMTVDVAHQKDREAVRAVREGRVVGD
ncbi:MAG: hypothetical protein ACT4QF_11770 [Sporichthyaceae bacterium]